MNKEIECSLESSFSQRSLASLSIKIEKLASTLCLINNCCSVELRNEWVWKGNKESYHSLTQHQTNMITVLLSVLYWHLNCTEYTLAWRQFFSNFFQILSQSKQTLSLDLIKLNLLWLVFNHSEIRCSSLISCSLFFEEGEEIHKVLRPFYASINPNK